MLETLAYLLEIHSLSKQIIQAFGCKIRNTYLVDTNYLNKLQKKSFKIKMKIKNHSSNAFCVVITTAPFIIKRKMKMKIPCFPVHFTLSIDL